MPSYELALLLKKLGRAETATVLKRTAQNIFKNQGVLFAIENLGTRSIPYAVSLFGRRYKEGSYFLMRLDLPAGTVDVLKDEYKRDTDILRAGFIREKEVIKKECTLDEELKPPAYRQDVKKMIEEGRKKERRFQLNIGQGQDSNPFNR